MPFKWVWRTAIRAVTSKTVRQGGFWFCIYTIFVLGATAVLCWLGWSLLSKEPSLSGTVRNIGLLSGGLVAMGLALWRSLVAKRQADTAQNSLLNDRYQRAIVLLESDREYVRIGGIYALRSLALDNLEEHGTHVFEVLVECSNYWTKDHSRDEVDTRDITIAQLSAQDVARTLHQNGFVSRHDVENMLSQLPPDYS